MIAMVLQLSTANMPSEYPDFGQHRHSSTGYGFIVWDSGCDAPEWLRSAMAKARELSCTIIEFDRDNETVPGLPAWDW